MKIFLALLLTVLSGAMPAKAEEIRHIGDFHNVSSPDQGEHCSGYSLELLEHKREVIGLFDVHAGLCGDPPCSVIRDVKFDEKRGLLSFQASIQGQVYRFAGTLKSKAVSGKVNGKAVRLAKEPSWSELDSDTNLSEWCQFWKTVPRCEGVRDLCVQ